MKEYGFTYTTETPLGEEFDVDITFFYSQARDATRSDPQEDEEFDISISLKGNDVTLLVSEEFMAEAEDACRDYINKLKEELESE